MSIDIVLNPPLPTDDEETFDAKAQQYVQDQVMLAAQINATAGQINTAASTASTKAGEAAGSASAAASAKGQAETAANAAATKAGEATASATAANDSKNAAATSAGSAGSAKSAAEGARDTAVSARDTAVAAKNDASSAKAAAEAARDTAVSAKNDATAAKGTAESAASFAGGAAGSAGDSASAAASARDAALAAKGGAEAAASAADGSAGAAAGSAAAAAQSAQDAAAAAEGEPTITKALGYATWDGSAWVFKNETPLLAGTRGAPNGVASLDANGKLPESQLPALAITDTFVVASQAAMLALTAERGDIAVRSDLNKTFALAAQPASTLANWVELRTPTDAVLSVAGRTGAVTLTVGDVSGAQATLVSGSNVKTVAGQSLVGSGNVPLLPLIPATTTTTANVNAVAGTTYNCDTSGGGFSLTLPASPADAAYVGIDDLKLAFSPTKPLTVNGNGQPIEGVLDNMQLNTPMRGGYLFRTGFGWRWV